MFGRSGTSKKSRKLSLTPYVLFCTQNGTYSNITPFYIAFPGAGFTSLRSFSPCDSTLPFLLVARFLVLLCTPFIICILSSYLSILPHY